MKLSRRFLAVAVLFTLLASCLISPPSQACTGITLKATDGAVLFGRTMEWSSFDLKSRVVVVPRGYPFASEMSDGKHGKTWTTQYGIVGLDGVGKDIILDGQNEKGLAVGLFYHPGTAVYQPYDPAAAADSMAPTDVGTYLLSTCATIDDVRAAITKVHVVPVVESSLGIVAPVHFLVTDSAGKAIVIEYLKGELAIFDAPLGVITNSPSYDWHVTNLRNYVNLSPVAIPDKAIGDLDFKPLGGGSGMIGLPGDFTPPSRFVRAVAFTKTARPTESGPETMYELFRILDNFNIPLSAAEGPADNVRTQGMRSATQWTTCHDLKNNVLYYHTQNNRRVRQVELNSIDFAKPTVIQRLPLDKDNSQDIETLTFGK